MAVTLVLGWCPSRAQEVKKTKAFEYTAWMERTEGGLKVRGYLGEKAARIDVPVSAMLTVEKVPVTYIKAHYEHATHVVGAEGFPSKKASEIPSLVMGIAERWLVPLILTAEKGVRQQQPMLDLIRADAKLHAELVKHFAAADEPPDKILAGLPDTGLGARQLLPENLAGRGGNPPLISIIRLLRRFDPQAVVNEQNADSVAEEILWSKELGIGDGTYKTLPQSRLILQAAILENLNFEIGYPGDKDNDKATKAKAKLAEAKKTVIKTWLKAAEGK